MSARNRAPGTERLLVLQGSATYLAMALDGGGRAERRGGKLSDQIVTKKAFLGGIKAMHEEWAVKADDAAQEGKGGHLLSTKDVTALVNSAFAVSMLESSAASCCDHILAQRKFTATAAGGGSGGGGSSGGAGGAAVATKRNSIEFGALAPTLESIAASAPGSGGGRGGSASGGKHGGGGGGGGGSSGAAEEIFTQLWAGYCAPLPEVAHEVAQADGAGALPGELILVDIGSGELKYFHVKLPGQQQQQQQQQDGEEDSEQQQQQQQQQQLLQKKDLGKPNPGAFLSAFRAAAEAVEHNAATPDVEARLDVVLHELLRHVPAEVLTR